MEIFFIVGLVGAVLATSGAAIGESDARRSKKDRRKFALRGALLGVWAGALAVLLLSFLEAGSFSTLPLVAIIWSIHGLMVSAAAAFGVLLAYNPRRSQLVSIGPFVACLVASPGTCLPLLALMCA